MRLLPPIRGGPRPGPGVARAAAGAAAVLLLLLGPPAPAGATEVPEYRLKAAFLYNFAAFTEWPADVGPRLALCIAGPDPFGDELVPLQGKAVGARTIDVQRRAAGEPLKGCHVVFFSGALAPQLPRLAESLRGQPVLTVADTPGAVRAGVALNMTLAQGRVTFEANVGAARAGGLTLSARLLRLATEVVQ